MKALNRPILSDAKPTAKRLNNEPTFNMERRYCCKLAIIPALMAWTERQFSGTK